MDFKKLFALLALLSVAACSPVDKSKDDSNIIGARLEKVSALTKADGSESSQVAVFDEKVHRIHQFELSTLTYQRSYDVANPNGRHVVLVQEEGNYVIDLCEKQLTIFSKTGLVQNNPVKIEGQPISAAYRSALNLLVIYDDLNNVHMMQMNEMGVVLHSWSGGSRISTLGSVVSGDMLESGKLVLSTTDGSLAVIDTEQSILQKQWKVESSFAANMTDDISWIAPVGDNANQVFVRSGSKVAIFDTITKALVVDGTLPNNGIEKLSKVSDGHIVLRSEGDRLDLIYAAGSQLQARTLHKQEGSLALSQLDARRGIWTFVEMSQSLLTSDFTYNDVDYTKIGRTLKRFSLANMDSVRKMPVVDQAQILISPRAIFALFPSDFGKAARYDMETDEVKNAEFFNAAGGN
jgi:hypothetical protein